MVNIRVAIIPHGNPNRPGTKLAPNVSEPYITVHETANTDPGTDAEMHRKFTHGGGGPELVSFHFVVDDHEAVQLLPLDEVGWHAGDGCDEYPDGVGHDDIGCFGSVAIETCVNSDGNWSKTVANLEQLMAQIILGNSSIVYGDGRYKGKFKPTKIAQHNAWSGKNCPAKIRATGVWPAIVADTARIVGAEQPNYATPLPVPPYDGTDKVQNKAIFRALTRIVRAKSDTTPRAWGSEDAPAAGKPIKAGRTFESRYIVEGGSGQWWYISKEGWRILMAKCVEQFRPTGKDYK